MAEQLDLFSRMSLNPLPELKRLMRTAIKESGLSRAEVAVRMNDLAEIEALGKEVSLDCLNSWLKNEDNRHVPMELLVIFCKAVGSVMAMQAFLAPVGALAVDRKELAALELGQAAILKKQARRKEKMALLKLQMED